MDKDRVSSCVNDDAEAHGEYLVEVIRDGKNGPEVVQSVVAKNLIVNTGKRQLWRAASGLNVSLFKFMRFGSNSAAAVSADTNVKTPVTGTLKTFNSLTLLAGTRTWQMIVSLPSGVGTKSATFKEIAILNQHTSPGGSALSRAVLSPTVIKTTTDKLRVTYKARIT